jgi:hypothetical protein
VVDTSTVVATTDSADYLICQDQVWYECRQMPSPGTYSKTYLYMSPEKFNCNCICLFAAVYKKARGYVKIFIFFSLGFASSVCASGCC